MTSGREGFREAALSMNQLRLVDWESYVQSSI